MLLGEHEHSLDDKNRLTLPAKLREQLGDDVVITRGLDGCLYVYARGAWDVLAARIGGLDSLSADTRRMQRHFFVNAHGRRARQAGTDGDPGAACSSATGIGREVTVDRRLRPPRDLGSRRVARAAARGRRERRRCCRASCQPRLITSPSSRTRCSPPRAAPGRDGDRLHLRRRRPRGAARRAAARRGQADRDRPRPDRRAVLRAAPPRRPRAEDAAAPRRVLDRARAARRERRARRRDPARPRRLVDAARPARARLLVRRRRAARHAHGSRRPS